MQQIRASVDVDFAIVEAPADEGELRARVEAAFHEPFDLERGPVFRARLFRTSMHESVLLLVVHHIVADFWSLLILVDELRASYLAAKAGATSAVMKPDADYADFVKWQSALLASSEGERLWAYWRQQLAGEPPLLILPTDRPRPAVQTYAGDSYTFALDAHLTRKLKALAKTEGATLHTTLLAAFQALLFRYTGQEDFLVGSLVSGRSRAEFADVVGYFTNPIALRARPAGHRSFRELLAETRDTLLGAIAHQDFPFADMVERLHPSRDVGQAPLLNVMFVLQQPQRVPESTPFMLGQAGGRMQFGDLSLESLPFQLRQARFDLDLMMLESGDSLSAFLQYNTALFDAVTITRLSSHLETMLEGIVANPGCDLASLPLLSTEERQRLASWNETGSDYPRDLCVQQLFERQAAATPHAIAAVFADQQLTYAELNQRANQLAHHLRALDLPQETRVAICMERSLGMVVGLLGILKAGMMYVPLDPADPAERLAFILEDTGAPLVLTASHLLPRLPVNSARAVCLEASWHVIGTASVENPVPLGTSGSLAYLIYTSGSTGRPKGVSIPHRSLVNFLCSMRRQPGLTERDTLVAVTTLSFDIAGLELFLPLTVGARVVIASRDEATDGSRLAELLRRSCATVMRRRQPRGNC